MADAKGSGSRKKAGAKSRGARAGAKAGGSRRAAPEPPPQPASPFTPGMAPECMMCPFGLVMFAVRQTKPEVMEHLLKAGQELTLAVKALVDSAAERWDQAESLQRIPVR